MMPFRLPPKVWIQAYLLVCLWYFVNLAFSSIVTYYLFAPQLEELMHGLALFGFYVCYIGAVWCWARLLWGQRIAIQATGLLLGMLLGFLAVSWVSYEMAIYFDNRTAESFGMYLLSSHSGTKVSGKMDAFRIYNEYMALLFIAYAIRYARNLKKEEEEKRQLLVRNKDMQLHLLKSQINPHFLFNTLNTISMLVSLSKAKARKVISQLSDILRYTLETGEHQTVPLAEELQFIEKYLDIQLVRFDNSFAFCPEIDKGLRDLLLPPMVLQPLVENAVKYGVGQRAEGGIIWLRVQQRERGVYVEVADNGPGSQAKQAYEGQSSTGIGLKNTDARLRQMYGPAAALNIKANAQGFAVGFLLPLLKN